MHPKDVSEPLLREDPNRLTIFPIQYKNIWDWYKKMLGCFWVVEEVDLSGDKSDWLKLSEDEKYFIKHILAFFAASDTIVNQNIGDNFLTSVGLLEAKYCYGTQYAIENIHSEAYSLMINTYIEDIKEQEYLLNGVRTIPCVAKKAKWALKWATESHSFAQRLVAFSIVEGIFFSGSFAAIFWLKEKNLMTGLCKFNEFISRDEGMHTQFASFLYKEHIIGKLDQDIVHDMIREAVEIETEFITVSLPCRLLGMNDDIMAQYIKFVADNLCHGLGYDKIYNTTNPFGFMDKISMQAKQNFFEARATEYKTGNSTEWDGITLDF